MIEVGHEAPDFTLPGRRGRRAPRLHAVGVPRPQGRARVLSRRLHARAARGRCARTATTSRSSRERARCCSASRRRTSTATRSGPRRGASTFPLLADTEKKVIDAYGVGARRCIGVRRSVFVIDPDGIVRFSRPQGDRRHVRADRQARPGPRGALSAPWTSTRRCEFVRRDHRGVLATPRATGGPQMSPIACAVDADGRVVVSTRETAMKVKNLAATRTRRDLRAERRVLRRVGRRSRARPRSCSLPEAMDGSSTTTAASPASTRTGTTTAPRWSATARGRSLRDHRRTRRPQRLTAANRSRLDCRRHADRGSRSTGRRRTTTSSRARCSCSTCGRRAGSPAPRSAATRRRAARAPCCSTASR